MSTGIPFLPEDWTICATTTLTTQQILAVDATWSKSR